MENINKKIEAFREYLISEEKSENTKGKYIRDVRAVAVCIIGIGAVFALTLI